MPGDKSEQPFTQELPRTNARQWWDMEIRNMCYPEHADSTLTRNGRQRVGFEETFKGYPKAQ